MAAALPQVEVLPDAAAAVPLLLAEVRALLRAPVPPLLGLATGATFTGFLRALGGELASGRMSPVALRVTHLDEYLDFGPERSGGMVHELFEACPPLRTMWAAGAFLPVPGAGDAASLTAHHERLAVSGGVTLQLLGIGRNGHIAFNEPGTSFDLGFHTVELAEATRQDARARFAPGEPPRRAVTSGPATILAARRLVLCAFGAAKAQAVRAMLQGPVTTDCPASVLQRHADVRVLLDPAAASQLDRGAALGR